MPWFKLTLHADPQGAELLSEWLAEAGAIAVTLEDASHRPFSETHWDEHPHWKRVRVSALFPWHTDAEQLAAQAVSRFRLVTSGRAVLSLLEEEDWAESWKAHYKPISFGCGLWVVPSWCTPPQPTAINLIIDPGLAFGTGDHPTTALCLEWLTQQPLTGAGVLDYGCGSGILAIAALKLGAAEAWAVDIDPQALEVARANAERNAVAARLHVLDPSALPAGFQADIVVANILASTLIELAPQLSARTRPGGRLALSGLLTEQADEVRAHYAAAFALEARHRSSWVLLAGRKTVE